MVEICQSDRGQWKANAVTLQQNRQTAAYGMVCTVFRTHIAEPLENGSMERQASTIASEIASQTLSGWPAETDSEVNNVAIIDDGDVSPS